MEEIRRAYRAKARLYHPDANPPELRGWAEEQMKLLNQAYALMKTSRGSSREQRGKAAPAELRRPEVLTATNPFDVLGVYPQASDEDIAAAYASGVGAWHPDHNPDLDPGVGFRAVSRLDAAYREAMAREKGRRV